MKNDALICVEFTFTRMQYDKVNWCSNGNSNSHVHRTHTLLLVHKCIVCINSLCVKVDIYKGSNKWWKVFSRTIAVKLTIVAETVVHTVKWYQSILIWITISPWVVRSLNLFWILTLAMFFTNLQRSAFEMQYMLPFELPHFLVKFS